MTPHKMKNLIYLLPLLLFGCNHKAQVSLPSSTEKVPLSATSEILTFADGARAIVLESNETKEKFLVVIYNGISVTPMKSAVK